FFSKDAIIAGIFETKAFGPTLTWLGPALGVILLVAALGTAFYMSRLYFLVFSGKETRAPEDVQHHIHESPPVMVVPLMILAVGAFAGGWLGLPGGIVHHPEWNLLGHQLEPVVGPEIEVGPVAELWFMGLSTALGLA